MNTGENQGTSSLAEARDIFAQAIDLDGPEDRQRYVEEACAGKPQLLAEVSALLRAYQEAGDFLEPADQSRLFPVPAVIGHQAGSQVGPYTLVKKLGEGGFGEVFLAEQKTPLQRQVALKVIKPGLDTREVIACFQAERQVLALLEHPQIATIFEAGATDGERPFFAMEFVDGLPLTEYCDLHRLPIVERLQLFLSVCRAVQHAHQKGVIHRDLKPSNLLVTQEDGQAIAKVIDFGIAKATNRQLLDIPLATLSGQMIGTPQYMSPEQAEGGANAVDTRSDIYSLGVILYELLVGTTPLDQDRLKQTPLSHLPQLICTSEITRPSKRLEETGLAVETITSSRGTERGRLRAMLRSDLDWIVLKALEKERDRRYETVDALARDLSRFLEGQPIEARPPSLAYRFRKLGRRYKVALITGTAFVLLIVAATMVSTLLAVWALDAERLANQRLVEMEEAKRTAQSEQARSQNNLGTLYLLTGRPAEAQAAFQQALRINQRLVHEKPKEATYQNQLAHTHNRLGTFYGEWGNKAEALVEHQQALKIRKRLTREHPTITQYQNDLASSHNRVGMLYHADNKPAEAFAEFQQALKISERLVREYPGVADYQIRLANIHNSIAFLYVETGRRAEALVRFEQALKISEQLVAKHPTVAEYRNHLAGVQSNMGTFFSESGQLTEALAAYEKALTIRQRLADENPTVTEHQHDLAMSHYNIGVLHAKAGKPGKALLAHEQARKIRERLARQNPMILKYQDGLANSLASLGDLYRTTHKPTEALNAFNKGLIISKQLADENPTVAKYQTRLANVHQNLGILYSQMDRSVEAQAGYEKALAIWQRLTREYPTAIDYQLGWAGCCINLATSLRLEQPDDALDLINRAIPVLKKVLEQQPDHAQARLFQRNAYWNRAEILGVLARHREAVEDWHKALELDSGQTRSLFQRKLCLSLARSGQYAQAGALATELAKERVHSPDAAYDFACLYALFVDGVERDANLDDDVRQRGADQHARRAVALLKALAKSGYFHSDKNRRKLQRDPDLKALRQRDAFRQFAKSVSVPF